MTSSDSAAGVGCAKKSLAAASLSSLVCPADYSTHFCITQLAVHMFGIIMSTELLLMRAKSVVYDDGGINQFSAGRGICA